jgi:hypothetical protein
LRLGDKTSTSNVHIQWNALPSSDGPSIDYRVYWNSGPQNDDWKILTETTSGATEVETSAQATFDYTDGDSFRFKVQGKNIIGLGPNSTVIDANPLQEILDSNSGMAAGILGAVTSIFSVCG